VLFFFINHNMLNDNMHRVLIFLPFPTGPRTQAPISGRAGPVTGSIAAMSYESGRLGTTTVLSLDGGGRTSGSRNGWSVQVSAAVSARSINEVDTSAP